MEITEERKFKIRTNKNNEMELLLRNYNNEELSITIFNNIEELIIELDSKIEKTTILEETNLLVLDIPIGLKIIINKLIK